MKRIKFIAQKELYHILRDLRSLMIIFAMPVMMTFLYGYAINMDVEHVTLAVMDMDQSTESRALIDRFYSSGHFHKPKQDVQLADPEAIFRSNQAAAVLTIKSGFSESLIAGKEFSLGLLIDGSDATLGGAMQAYGSAILNQYLLDRMPNGQKIPGIRISQQVLYNPDLKSANFFVPGLVAVILLMISALLTSITIAREKETGTMEQLLTTPVKPIEIIIGKLLPYMVIGFLDGCLVLLFAKFIFHVPFLGSPLLLAAAGVLYITTALSIGMLISSLVKTQQVAMMLALTTTMMPSVMLSGFIFAIKNFPIVMQGVSFIIPARYFVVIVRGIMLKGAGTELLLWQAAGLVTLMLIFLTIALRKFSTRVA